MARPPRQDPETTRRQVLALARRDVLAHGLEGLSLRRMARELGYAPGSLYRYFENRDAIARALAEDVAAAVGARLALALRAAPGHHDLVTLGLAYVRASLEHPEDSKLASILSTRRSLSDPVPTHSPYRLLLGAVEEAAGRGEVSASAPAQRETIAYAIWALAEGMVALRRGHLRDFAADFRDADAAAFAALLRGFSRGPRAAEPGGSP